MKGKHDAEQLMFLSFPGRLADLPQRLSGEESVRVVGDAGDLGSISELGRSPGGGSGNPLQYKNIAWRIPGTEEPGEL